MKEVFVGFKNQWTKWAAIGLIVILASMAYVHLAREWSAFRVLLIAVVGLTLGLVESHIPGPSHVFTWVNASRLLGAALIIFLLASFIPNRTKAATEWIAGNIDKNPASASASAPTGQEIKKPLARTERFAINADSWSEPKNIPVGWDFVVIDEKGPGHLKVKFWSGEVVSDATKDDKPDPKWRGTVKNCTFQVQRISGEGFAILVLTPPA